MLRLFAIGLIVTFGSGNVALGFGADGHEAVCEVAYRELTPKVKAEVDRLIALDYHDRVKTFRDSCVWPDFVGPIQKARKPEHYINIPRKWESIWRQKCHGADTCLFTGIATDIETLSSEFASDAEKLLALKFLGHWVGDIHQPLHVSYADDRGGNYILVEGVAGCKRKGQTKLHAVWDTCIPKEVMKTLRARQVAPDDDDREAFGMLLHKAVTAAQRAQWRASLSPLQWANESLVIARQAEVGYCTLSSKSCRYSTGSLAFVKNDQAGDGMRTFTPTGDYEDRFIALSTERMQAAGVRLGAVLNAILSK
jgi:hypothetical protein